MTKCLHARATEREGCHKGAAWAGEGGGGPGRRKVLDSGKPNTLLSRPVLYLELEVWEVRRVEHVVTVFEVGHSV
jgi:hypothetical protein